MSLTPVANLLSVSLIPVAICLWCPLTLAANLNSEYRWQTYRQCCWYRWQFGHQCCWHPRQNYCRCHWHQWQICTLTCEYLCEWKKNWENPNFIFRSLGKDDSWKNLKQKISWRCPFKCMNISEYSTPLCRSKLKVSKECYFDLKIFICKIWIQG